MTFSGTLGVGLLQLGEIGDALDTMDEVWLPLAQASAELEVVVRQIDRNHERLVRDFPRPQTGTRTSRDLFGSQMLHGQLSEQTKQGRALIDEISPNQTDSVLLADLRRARDLLEVLDEKSTEYDQNLTDLLNQPSPANSGKALAELERQSTDLVLTSDNFSTLVEEGFEGASLLASNAHTRASTISAALAVLAGLLASGMALVALVTLRPIGALTENVQRLAAGKSTGRVQVTSNDEVGALAKEFNFMADAVAERDRRLVERAEALDRLSLRLRQVLDAMHAGLIVVEDGHVQMTNPAAKRLWGAEPNTTLPSDLAQLLPPVAVDHPSQAPVQFLEHPMADRLVDLEFVPFGSRGHLIVGEDVTHRVKARERLARTKRLALVGQMLAQITHEVRNPLNAMSLNAELLADDLVGTESKEMLDVITSEIRRLEALTGRYLEMSRGRRPEIGVTDPIRMMQEIATLEEEAFRQVNAQLSIKLPPPLEHPIELDADALRRALRNILKNAIEAGARHVEINLEIGQVEITIAVSDDGPGMTGEQVSRVFDPFYTTKASGTGLGLAISRQELEEVGGGLRCESTPGQGTTFWLTVPTSISPEGVRDTNHGAN